MKNSTKIIFIFIVTFFLIRNMLIPMAFDDYVYAFIWNGTFSQGLSSLERVNSLYDVFISQWTHYFTWGGRIISHTFVQFFIMIGKEYFNIANTFIFVILLWLINKIGTNDKTFTTFNLVWIFLGIWVCTAQLAFTTIWLSGTCNYMWMTVLQLAFLLPYINALRNNKNINNSRKLWIIPLGIIAGWTNEAGSIATIVMTFIIVIALYQQRRIEKWHKFGLAALIVGCVLLIAAPGNMVRMNMNHPGFHWNLELIINYLHGSFYEILIKNFVLYVPIAYYFLRRGYEKWSANDSLILTFALGGLTVPTVMLVSPEFFSHVGFPSTIFFTISSTIAINEIYRKKLYMKLSNFMLSIIKYVSFTLVGACVLSMLLCIYSDVSIYRQVQSQFAYVMEHKNDDCIYVKPLKYSRKCEKILGMRIPAYQLKHIGGVVKDTKHYYNEVFCKYYGLNKISASDK